MLYFSAKKEIFDPVSAQALLDENHPDDAVKMAEERLEQAPEDIDAKIILCQGLLRLGKLEQLRMRLRDVDETVCRLSRVYLRLGELCRHSGLHAESKNFLNKYEMLAAVFASDDHRATEILSGPPIETADNESANNTDTDDISPEFYTVTLAELYMRQGHPDQAREVLNTILARDPENEQAAIKLTELDGTLTKAECNVSYNPVFSDGTDFDAALIGELESWLVQLGRLRSPAL